MGKFINKSPLFFDMALFLVAIIWGSGFPITNMAVLSGITPALLVGLRFSIPTAFFGIVFYREIVEADKKELLYSFVAGLLLFGGFVSQMYGIKYTTPSNNAFLTTANVIMVPFIGWIAFKQRPSLKTVLLSAVCFAGMAILAWSPNIGINFNLGDRLTLVCAFCFACHISYLGICAQKVKSTAVLTFMQMAVVMVLGFVVFFATEYKTFQPESLKAGIWPCIYLGIFPTGFCFFMQTWVQKKVSATRTALILSTEGLFGSLLSVLIGYDRITPNLIFGGGIILLSVTLIQVDWSGLKLRSKKI